MRILLSCRRHSYGTAPVYPSHSEKCASQQFDSSDGKPVSHLPRPSFSIATIAPTASPLPPEPSMIRSRHVPLLCLAVVCLSTRAVFAAPPRAAAAARSRGTLGERSGPLHAPCPQRLDRPVRQMSRRRQDERPSRSHDARTIPQGRRQRPAIVPFKSKDSRLYHLVPHRRAAAHAVEGATSCPTSSLLNSPRGSQWRSLRQTAVRRQDRAKKPMIVTNKDRRFWAFVPLKRPSFRMSRRGLVPDALDRFILAKLEERS